MEPDYTAMSDIIDIGDNFDHIVDDSVISHTLSRYTFFGGHQHSRTGAFVGMCPSLFTFQYRKEEIGPIVFF